MCVPLLPPVVEPAAPFAHHLSGSNEWYTPKVYVDAVRILMAGITLDPASCAFANQVVRAAMYYDIDSNGLDKPWEGSVFLNPPYGWDEDGESNVAVWTAKLLAEFAAGSVQEAVLLVNATTERKWFQPLWQFPICFTTTVSISITPMANKSSRRKATPSCTSVHMSSPSRTFSVRSARLCGRSNHERF